MDSIDTGIKEVGCTSDGRIWANAVIALDIAKTKNSVDMLLKEDVREFAITVTLLMGQEKAAELIGALQQAIKNAQAWVETGVEPS